MMIEWNDPNVTFYIDDNPFGEIKLANTYDMEHADDIPPIIRKPSQSCEISCDVYVGRDVLMYLCFGKKVTNNWLKMHGGIMRRKRRKNNEKYL